MSNNIIDGVERAQHQYLRSRTGSRSDLSLSHAARSAWRWDRASKLGLLLLLSACHQQAPEQNPAPAGPATTATVLNNIDPKDVVEDASYAAPGEGLAREAGKDTLGKPAPAATMTTIDGQTIDLSKIYGTKPVYIKFWATWCVPCRQQMPAFEKVYETMGDKMQLIAVDIGLNDDIASVREFRKKFGLKMPIVFDDGHLGTLFNLRVTPQHVLIGKDVRFDYIGHADTPELAQAIHKAIADTPTDIAAAASATGAARIVRPGDMLPDISVRTTAGLSVPLKARPGRLLAVELFSSWCEWYLKTNRPDAAQACARTRVEINRIANTDHDIDWLGIAGGPWATAQDLHDYQTKNAIAIPLALDKSNAIFRLLGVRDIPTIALIDATGRLIKVIGPLNRDLAGSIAEARRSLGSGTKR